MTEGIIDLRLLLQSASEPQTNKFRNNNKKNKSNNSKENRASKAGNKGSKGKKEPEHVSLDNQQVERFFNAAENVVFTSHRHCPQPPQPATSAPSPAAPGIQDLALLNRLAISSPSKECGSPMSIENQPQDGGSPFTKTTLPPSPPPAAAQNANNNLTNNNNPIEQPHPLPPVPPLSTQDIDLMYRQRCSLDSDAMLTSCPPHLLQVHQTYLKQAEAIKLADQCNAGLPVIVEPEVLLSVVSQVPKKPQVIGGAQPQNAASGDGAQQAPPQPAFSEERSNAAKTEDPGVDGTAIVEKEVDPGCSAATEQPVVEFSFKFNDYQQKGTEDTPACHTEEQQQQEHQREESDDKESDRKRARSDESAALMKQMQDAYAAALAQLNAPPAAPLPLPRQGDVAAVANENAVSTGAAKPTISGDSSSSSLALAPPPPLPAALPRRTQEAIRVFCIEKENERSGLFYRNFTATSYANVWRSYVNAQRPGTLHWYEVIREGRPCHLYFDLEYGRSTVQNFNVDVDGDALVDALLHHVGVLLLRNWGLKLDVQSQVYELDSSTTEKFSRHVIVRLPGHAFFHNLAIGHFVSQVLEAAGSEFNVLRNSPPSEERASFVDTAVYTKNRHFRLVYSCKGGKSAILRPTERYATGVQGVHRLSPARIFNDTLICNVDEDVKLLAVLPPFRNPTDGIPGALLSTGHAATAHPGSGGGGNINNNNMNINEGNGGIHQGDVYGRTVAWKRSENETECSNGGGNEAKLKFLKELKTVAEKAVVFVEQAAKQRSGLDARARTVAFCGMDGLVAYSMIGPGSHYCEHIGRSHKNNHVYFVVNFLGGVYAQKCHDPDCSRFRSAWMPLPKEFCLSTESEPQQ